MSQRTPLSSHRDRPLSLETLSLATPWEDSSRTVSNPWALLQSLQLMHSSQKPFPLSRLPGELRNAIYRAALVRPLAFPYKPEGLPPNPSHYKTGDISVPTTNLLLASRRTYQEAVSILYSENTFSFSVVPNLVRFLNLLMDSPRKLHLRVFNLEFTPMMYDRVTAMIPDRLAPLDMANDRQLYDHCRQQWDMLFDELPIAPVGDVGKYEDSDDDGIARDDSQNFFLTAYDVRGDSYSDTFVQKRLRPRGAWNITSRSPLPYFRNLRNLTLDMTFSVVWWLQTAGPPEVIAHNELVTFPRCFFHPSPRLEGCADDQVYVKRRPHRVKVWMVGAVACQEPRQGVPIFGADPWLLSVQKAFLPPPTVLSGLFQQGSETETIRKEEMIAYFDMLEAHWQMCRARFAGHLQIYRLNWQRWWG
ncbi:MAG: hypothetical protein M1819_003951 [Sarea resinae]|nr:MAG: hypothetical protein M1819_003951 [Sarea resinae]